MSGACCDDLDRAKIDGQAMIGIDLGRREDRAGVDHRRGAEEVAVAVGQKQGERGAAVAAENGDSRRIDRVARLQLADKLFDKVGFVGLPVVVGGAAARRARRS